ncbi:DUF6907 domain-containing protein [Streptomyces gardneri]|uniref:DUF6907 domain-containing protein n=1 Tax=Streptomyces gardneri TaxID=66892 RepID=UPI0035DEA32F
MATQQLSGTRLAGACPSSRLVPTSISGARVHIECPSWCTNDHSTDRALSAEDLWHGSEYEDLMAPVIDRADTTDVVLFARLGLDPGSQNPLRRSPFIVVADSSDATNMTPDGADVFADNLEAFAAQIRQLARAARGGTQ